MKMKKSSLFVIVILALLVNGVFISALTGSMGNSRMILYPEVNGWTNTVIPKTILVKNVNDVAVNITLERDKNATEFIDLIDETFILQPGEEKKAQIEVKVRKEGKYEGRINVFFAPADGQGSGVVLTSTIIVIAKRDQGYEEPREEEEENNVNGTTTGSVIGGGNNGKLSNAIKLWGTTTFILLVILLVLVYIWGKKRNQSKYRKRKNK